jgi:uncharacterized protein YecT (DUF1311 family)
MTMIIVLAAALASTNCEAAPSNVEMKECAARELANVDAALNRQYTQTLAKMRTVDKGYPKTADNRPGFAATLLASQRAWLTFRDAQCTIEGYSMRGGTGEGLVVATCKAAMTAERTKALAKLESN